MGAARIGWDRGRCQAVLVAGKRLDRFLPQRAAAQGSGRWRACRQDSVATGRSGAALQQLSDLDRGRHHPYQPGCRSPDLSCPWRRRGTEGALQAPGGDGLRCSRSRRLARRRDCHDCASSGRHRRACGPRQRHRDDRARSQQRQQPAVFAVGTSRVRPGGSERRALGGSVLHVEPGGHRRAVPDRARDRAVALARRHPRFPWRRAGGGAPAGVVHDGWTRGQHHCAATAVDRRGRPLSRRTSSGGVSPRWTLVL